nr:unnamed protein product [Spirometra erinaceieuropaei]
MLPGEECWVSMISMVSMTVTYSSYKSARNSRLILTNTLFRLQMREKATWMHPRSRQWHLLEYVLVRRRDQRDMLGTKAIPDADGMVRQLHGGMMAQVTNNGFVSEAFALTNRVKQGCVLTPILFSLMFTAMFLDPYRDERPKIRVAYRADGQLLNHNRMHFQTRVSKTTVHKHLYADDCAPNATTKGEVQESMNIFAAACENFDLIINTEKTVVMHQPPPNTVHNAPQITVNGT